MVFNVVERARCHAKSKIDHHLQRLGVDASPGNCPVSPEPTIQLTLKKFMDGRFAARSCPSLFFPAMPIVAWSTLHLLSHSSRFAVSVP